MASLTTDNENPSAKRQHQELDTASMQALENDEERKKKKKKKKKKLANRRQHGLKPSATVEALGNDEKEQSISFGAIISPPTFTFIPPTQALDIESSVSYNEEKEEPQAKRQRQGLKPSTVAALENDKKLRSVSFGTFILPAGVESACGIFSNVTELLDTKSLLALKESSLIKQFRKEFGSNDFECYRKKALHPKFGGYRNINELIYLQKKLYEIYYDYRSMFVDLTREREVSIRNGRGELPTPFLCACELGNLEDVQAMVDLFEFHRYVWDLPYPVPWEVPRPWDRHLRGLKGEVFVSYGASSPNGSLNEMISHFGVNCDSDSQFTPLMAAVFQEHPHIVQYLLDIGADASVTVNDAVLSDGFHMFDDDHEGDFFDYTSERTALHLACFINMSIDIAKLLLEKGGTDQINRVYGGSTPLDVVFAALNNHSNILDGRDPLFLWGSPNVEERDSTILDDFVKLLRAHGGKANRHDINGNETGYGSGDLDGGMGMKKGRLVLATDLVYAKDVLSCIPLEELNKEHYGTFRDCAERLYTLNTLLDFVYANRDNPIREDLIKIIQDKGGEKYRRW